MASYTGIGLMSGTSLDGLDICCAEFTGDIETDVWGYRIEKATTIPYTEDWSRRLNEAYNLSGMELIKLNADYGHFIGQCVAEFIENKGIKVDFVASHGHTVFHQPENGFTYQLGDGETTSTYLPCPFVCNFRAKDVALGGQGAPLVPSGEKFLFRNTGLCINLGGIANIGVNGLTGFDVCPCNMVLNRIAKRVDPSLDFDKDGSIAASGIILDDLLNKLESLNYYKEPPPKSLGIEWISKEVFPLVDGNSLAPQDVMRTLVEHVTNRISADCSSFCQHNLANDPTTVLVTGGGAFNNFLIETLESKLSALGFEIQKTDEDTINYKEALVFAFLGLRTILNLDNIVSGSTGSRCDSVSGSIHRALNPRATSPTIQDRFNVFMRRKSSVKYKQ